MTVNEIVQLIVSILPTLITLLTVVGVIFKTLKEFAALKAQVADMKSIDALKEELQSILEENRNLKKTLNETLTKIDYVDRRKL